MTKAVVHEGSKYERPIRLYSGVQVAKGCHIGKYTYVRNNTSICNFTHIGRYCSIGDKVTIGASFHPIDRFTTHPFTYEGGKRFPGSDLEEKIEPEHVAIDKHTLIGNDCWIGTGSLVLAGVTIGDGAVIGMGAIITKDVEPYAIVVGHNRVISKRFEDEEIAQWLSIKWWDWSEEEINAIPKGDAREALEYCVRKTEIEKMAHNQVADSQ